MVRLLWVALGGAIGTVCRYILSSLDYKYSNGIFPVSTILINLIGSLVIGFLWGFFERTTISPNVRMFVFVGLLGGFTTFSTFCLENFNLIRDAEFKIALWNIIFTNVLGLVFVFFGFAFSRFILNLFK